MTQEFHDLPTNPMIPLPTTEGIDAKAVARALVFGADKAVVRSRSTRANLQRIAAALGDFIALRDSLEGATTNVAAASSPLQLCLRQLFLATREFYARGPLRRLEDLTKLCPSQLSQLLLWMHQASYDANAAHWFILSAGVDEIGASIARLDPDVAQALIDAERVLRATSRQ